MVLTSFNQKAYEEDLKNHIEEDDERRALRRGLILVVCKWLRKLFLHFYSSPATLRSKLLS